MPPVVTRPTGSVSVTASAWREVERHRDDLALELGLARAHVALQRVHVGEQPEGLVHERVVLVVAAVHRAGALAALPGLVLLLGHRGQLGEELLRGAALLGEGAVDGEPVFVRVFGHGAVLLENGAASAHRSCHPPSDQGGPPPAAGPISVRRSAGGDLQNGVPSRAKSISLRVVKPRVS